MKSLTKIQKFAQGKACQLRIPGVCRTTPDNEDTCLCHAPHPNRGGMRKDDHWGAVGCSKCHSLIDSGTAWRVYWHDAIYEWQEMLKDNDLMTVEGKEPGLPKTLPRKRYGELLK